MSETKQEKLLKVKRENNKIVIQAKSKLNKARASGVFSNKDFKQYRREFLKQIEDISRIRCYFKRYKELKNVEKLANDLLVKVEQLSAKAIKEARKEKRATKTKPAKAKSVKPKTKKKPKAGVKKQVRSKRKSKSKK